MNKQDIVEHIALRADISKASAARALDATLEAIQGALARGEQASIVGFGTFLVGARAARPGRNPRTGETIEIAAARSPRFRAGKALKEALN